MATGETPAPAFDYGGGALPHGQATALEHIQEADNSYTSTFGADTATPPQDFQPANDAEAFLGSPTDRPNEPMTHGVGFGPGANYTQFAYQGTNDLLRNVADQLAQDPNSDPEVRAFATAVNKGL